MRNKRQRDIVRRWRGNPIITLENLGFSAGNIKNCSAVKYKDLYILLVDIENHSGHHSIHIAESKDGSKFDVREKPFLELRDADTADIGVLDPRVTFLDGKYYIVYTKKDSKGFRLGLAETVDFKSVKYHGSISEPDTKAGTLFPEKINGKFARLDRPSSGGRIWISYSDDLVYWGSNEVVLSPRPGYWDASRIGCSIPPFRILDNSDWLIFYYGVKETSAGPIYRMGAAILDAENPSKVTARSNIPILSPREYYERVGDLNNIIYCGGGIVEKNTLTIYYGAADSCICKGTVKLKDVIRECIISNEDDY
jgi:beta-1,4-mannooligosaccharide/beta-1,4-mannosyl-N-acetylglucosamine phosphorylase